MDQYARNRKFLRVMQRDPHCEPPFVSEMHVSHTEMSLLVGIRILSDEKKKEYTTVSALAKQMHVSPPAISRTLRSLDAKGYIMRSPDPDDRRNTHISITESGLCLMKEFHERMDDFMERVLSHFTDEEFEQFCELQQKWKRFFHEEADHYKACAGRKHPEA